MRASSRRCYYLVSTAGIPNLGDELIAASWLRHLRQVAPDADVVLDCVNPAAVAAPLASMHPRLRLVSTLWQLCFQNWSAGIDAAAKVGAAVADPTHTGSLRDGIELLRQADVVHLTGGGFLNGIWPQFLGLLAGITEATQRSGAVAAVTGVGLWPPVTDGENLLAELAARFDVLDVRDEASAKLLPDLARYSCDDAFLRVADWTAAESVELPSVMVSLQFTVRPQRLFPAVQAAVEPADSPRGQLRERAMARLVTFARDTLEAWGVEECGLLECWPAADREVLELASRMLPRVRRYRLPEVLNNSLPVRAGQTWLSTRFHPHLFAAAAGASGLAVSLKADYYGTKHGSLIGQGSHWQFAEFDVLRTGPLPVPPMPAGGGFSAPVLAGYRQAKLEVAKQIYGGSRVER